MAKVIGESGAWKSVANSMASLGFQVEDISTISKMLADENSKLKAAEINSKELLFEEEQAFSQRIEELTDEYQKAVETAKEKSFENESKILERIKRLEKPVSFLKKIKQSIKLTQEKQKLKTFKKRSLAFFKSLEAKKDELEAKIKRERDKNIFDIKGRVRKINFSIEMMQKILSSPNLAGALAELELIKLLSNLPANYIVMNDVKLTTERAVRFDNVWRKSAQIDTLVISPAGIFVVEVKNWSRDFVENNDFFSPYDQVKWAAYLCYKQTGIKTRSIVAHTGNIPAKPKNSYAKVIHIKDVNGFILYFKDQIVSDAMSEKIANQLSRRPYLL